MKRLAPVITGFICAALVVAAGASPSEAATRKVALGVSMTGPNGATTPNINQLNDFITEYGRKPATWSVWSTWGDVSNQAFPTAFLNQVKAKGGITPMIFWQPTGPAGTDYCEHWSQQDIIDGEHDAYITQWATAAKAYGGKVILRFEHEMNAYWFPWGLGRCDNTVERMIAGWRHVRQIFWDVGATNVKFLWSIYGKNNVAAIFPGDQYVDFVGLSAFNWAKTGPSSSKSMVTVFSAAMGALLPLSTKPIIAGEVGTRHLTGCATCDKAAWIANGYPAVYAKWPRIKALVYFNVDMTFNNQPDWRLTTPPAAKDAYKNLLTQTRFQGTFTPCPATGSC